MTTILYLAWYFPPIGGAGVQRSLKFARFLPESSVRPVMMTGPAALDSRWAPDDQSLLREVPEDLVVLRPSGHPQGGACDRLRHRLTGELVALTSYWQRFVLEQGEAAARQHDARAIFVTLGPFECLQGALALGQRTGLPVIADLRDPWALDEMRSYGHRLQHRLDLRRMHNQLQQCHAIVMNTPTSEQMMREFLRRQPAGGIGHVTNGYDREDFDQALPQQPADGRFRLVHTGYLHSDSARLADGRSFLRRAVVGGQRQGVNLWGRTHRYLLQAIEQLRRNSPELLTQFELHLHGVLSASDQQLIDASPCKDLVHTHGYSQHDEVVHAMRGADMLFLPMQGLPKGHKASIVPGKTYEYLASRRPILAAVPAGDARDFVQQAGAGATVEPDDVDGMATVLKQAITAGRQADRGPHPMVERFERRELARRLAEFLLGTL